jgi:hypothetical protein
VDIRFECVTPDGLSGKKRVWFRGIFHLIGILGESPFVSKLRKAESAQHSPARENHPRGRWGLPLRGVRTFQTVFYASAFFQLDVFAVPARVTQIVRRLFVLKENV